MRSSQGIVLVAEQVQVSGVLWQWGEKSRETAEEEESMNNSFESRILLC